jgi:basic membrane lipoprotein Med (substrate-binding protein (PBP1-ABC) superfamily)
MKNVMFAIAFIATMTLVSCGGNSTESTTTTTDSTSVNEVTTIDSTAVETISN